MTKPGSNNPMQKGKRRQKLHKDQNNIGDKENTPSYEDFKGKAID